MNNLLFRWRMHELSDPCITGVWNTCRQWPLLWLKVECWVLSANNWPCPYRLSLDCLAATFGRLVSIRFFFSLQRDHWTARSSWPGLKFFAHSLIPMLTFNFKPSSRSKLSCTDWSTRTVSFFNCVHHKMCIERKVVLISNFYFDFKNRNSRFKTKTKQRCYVANDPAF